MAAGNPADRRRSPRVESIHLVTLSADGPDAGGSAVEVGRTLDMSFKGVRVESTTEIAPGRELDVEIAIGDRVLRAKGRVIHAEAVAEGRWELGIELTDVPHEHRAALGE